MDDSENRIYSMLIFTAAVWGIQPICIKWLLAEWDPLTIVSVRYASISIILFAYLFWKHPFRHLFPSWRDLWYLCLMGFFGILLSNVLQFTGLRTSSVINCTLISATSPTITAFFAFFLIKERLNVLSWIGIAISFIGTLVVISNGSWHTIIHINFQHGDILMFLSQIAWAFYSLLIIKLIRSLHILVITAWAGFFGCLLTFGYGELVGQIHLVYLPMKAFGSLLYTVLLSGVLGMLFWNMGVKGAGPSKAAVFQNITPVVGMLGGYLILSEPLGRVQIYGALAIFIGVYMTTHSKQILDLLFIHHR